MSHAMAFVKSRGIWVMQDIDCLLWQRCVLGRWSLRDACDEYEDDFFALMEAGLNANFFTRNRWLDVETMVRRLKVDLAKLRTYLQVSDRQIDSWNLSAREKDLLGIAH